MRRTRKSKGGAYPFQGNPDSACVNGNYYSYNPNTLFSPASTRIGGKKRKKKRTRRYAGGFFDDRYSLFNPLYNLRDNAVNFWNMTQGSEQIPVDNVLKHPISNHPL